MGGAAAAPARRPRVEDLRIAGLTPMSGVDWPGRLVATVFLQGCPWACPYCQNYAILDPTAPGRVAWSRVRDLLARRHGLLDGVVFSGGEATRQAALVPAAREVRQAGYAIGLHTCGAFPRRLGALLDAGLLDWVGLDVKATRAHYELVAGRPGAGGRAWRALDLLLAHPGVDHEVRITVYPDGPDDAYEVAQACRSLGVRAFALQQARSLGAPPGFRATRPGWDAHCRELGERIGGLGFERFTYRPA